jgi:hypothetical protein
MVNWNIFCKPLKVVMKVTDTSSLDNGRRLLAKGTSIHRDFALDGCRCLVRTTVLKVIFNNYSFPE